MNLILLILIAIGSTFGNETTQKKEYCFLSQHAWHDSFSTADVLLKKMSKTDPKKFAYKMILDPELRMCFSFQAYPLDITKIDKYVTEFKIKYKESEINISERLRKRIVPLKLSPDASICMNG